MFTLTMADINLNCKMAKRAQAGIEYIILTGFLLFLLIPTISYAFSEANTNVKINQIDNAVRRIARSVNAVFVIGPGAKELITITLPNGVTGYNTSNNEIVYQATLFAQTSDFNYPVITTINGTLPVIAGTYRILIEAKEDFVQVGQRKLS